MRNIGDNILVPPLNLFLIIGGSAYAFVVLFGLLYFIASTSSKKRVLPRTPIEDDYEEPFVSIIVPTYNEEKNIANCLQTLKNLEYENYEIILSDGGSSDKTVAIAKNMIDNIVIDETLPEGWIGKNWGCHVGYKQAKGEYLLFVDADTKHSPFSLQHFMKIALERDTALLTVFPFQRIKRWWESINPIFYFASYLTYGGNNSINDPRKKNSHSASGQFMLFKRKDYEAIGGHESLKGNIVEDLALARRVKIKLGRLFFIDGSKLISTRMYPESPSQCWEGWKKCLFPGTKLTQPRRITGALMWFLWAMLAPVGIILSVLYAPQWYFILITSILYVFNLVAVFLYWNRKGTHQWVTYVFLPIVVVMFCILLAVSALELLIKKKTTWRGREYKPDLFTGSLYVDNGDIVDENNQLDQLETDIELELNGTVSKRKVELDRVPKIDPLLAKDCEKTKEPVPLTKMLQSNTSD
ncbi:MAG: glycosyltransferase family 2 protein [Asgard group archaeon]|nr:glycosyltransferase family 2 protein [Asgard group archaeon]